jgi:RNA polymerase sigma-70 factor (ECF subfamily)
LVRRTRFLTLYDVWCESVLKWIRALGGPAADREDIAQEVFLVASRRLQAFDGSNPAAWLYRITQALERKQNQRVVQALLSKMNVDRRAAFVLFEIDGLSGEEIAKIQGVSINTVWKRLHVARKEFLALVARLQRGYDPTAPLGRRRRKGDRT